MKRKIIFSSTRIEFSIVGALTPIDDKYFYILMNLISKKFEPIIFLNERIKDNL